MRIRALFVILTISASVGAIDVPRDSVPSDHLAWFGFSGPVQEVREYDYSYYAKKVWRFDRQGRLTEYVEYQNPFFGDGGCVFGLQAHYRYAYDAQGKIEFQETYNADYTTVDEYDDMVLELFPPQNKEINHFAEAEREFGDTTFCWSKWVADSESHHYYGRRYDRFGNWFEDVSADEDDYYCANVRVREISYYPKPRDPRLSSIEELPKGCNERTAFGLIFDFQGYVFEGSLYPLHDGRWIVLSYWCLDEEESIYIEDENGEPIPAASKYKDPFKGIRYPVIQTDSVSFMTRNYGGKTIKLYDKAKGKRVLYTLDVECSLDVLDADPKTRRLYSRSNPNDWMWEEQPFKSVIGWVDEEWVCANLLTTCP